MLAQPDNIFESTPQFPSSYRHHLNPPPTTTTTDTQQEGSI